MFVMVLNWSLISFDLMQFHNKFSYHALSTWDSIPWQEFGVRGPGSGAPGSSWVLAIQKPKKTCLWG